MADAAAAGGTTWLSSNAEAARKLKLGEIHPDVEALIKEEELDTSWTIGELLEEKKLPRPQSKQIHVLVQAPEGKKRKRDAVSGGGVRPDKKLKFFAKLLEECPKRESLPKEGDFLQLFEWSDRDCGQVKDIKAIGDVVGFTGSKFFVRKEVLCVLENLKIFKTKFDAGDLVNQFILMGSPGTGKSCILALLCFFVAVTTNQPVLWFRDADDAAATTRLLYEGKCYQWGDENGEMYNFFYDELDSRTKGFFWPCLDGLNQDEASRVNGFDRFDWGNRFTLLATSGQFDVKGENADCITLCLLPYWKRADLEGLACQLENLEEEEVSSRYFVSGGSLREFLRVDARRRVTAALAEVQASDHARALRTPFGCISNKQVERLRMRGVVDAADAACYVKPLTWKAGVTSLLALRHLATVMKPDFFEDLIDAARELKDERLEDAGLEGYFHALWHHQRSVTVDYCKCESVERKDDVNHETVSISCAPPRSVTCAGDSIEACVKVMEEWAEDPSPKEHYWIPADSLGDTIDAVARWKFPDEKVRICFLQLIEDQTHQTHKFDADVLSRLAQPFVDKGLPVCYMILLPSGTKGAPFASEFKLAMVWMHFEIN